MEINIFAQKVCAAIKNELGEHYELEVKEVVKNNGVVLHGLLVRDERRNIIPTIYLESFWEAYEGGMPFSVVIRRLLEVYREDTPREKVNMEFFQYFESVKDRICFRLIRRKGNEKLLKEIPYVEFKDLAICFFYAYCGEAIGDGSILIHHSHLDMWKVKTEELYLLAMKNTPLLFPWELTTMDVVLEDMPCFSIGEKNQLIKRAKGMKILSNAKKIQGAACMLYPGLLENLMRGQGVGCFVLPSSIHEVILLEDTGEEDPVALKEMVWEVNRSIVAAEEILSDNVYYYENATGEIRALF